MLTGNLIEQFAVALEQSVFAIWVRYSEGPLFRKSIIPANINPKAKPNANPKPNFSTVAHICSGLSE